MTLGIMSWPALGPVFGVVPVDALHLALLTLICATVVLPGAWRR